MSITGGCIPPLHHCVVLTLFGLEHHPVAGLQVPARWHVLRGVQTTGLLPTHLPAWQVSVCVQELVS